MNNLPTGPNTSPFIDVSSPHSSYTTETKVITTVALLLLGYYVLSVFDAWPATVNRKLYDIAVYLVPSQILLVMQHGMVHIGRLSPEDATFTRAHFGDYPAKAAAVHTLLGRPQLPFTLRKAKSISGDSNYVFLGDDNGPPGLGNWDNSCYQNSILQGLASLTLFVAFTRRSLKLCVDNHVPAATHEALSSLLEQLAATDGEKQLLWTPKILKSMDSWQQQDAQEYFSRLLEAVEKEASAYIKILGRSTNAGLECLRQQPSAQLAADPPSLLKTSTILPTTQPLSARPDFHRISPLDGMSAQGLECQTCGFTEGLCLTQFSCLTLNMGLRGRSDLEDLLDEYTAPEMVDGVECENCTKIAHQTEQRTDGIPDPEQLDGRPSRKPTPILRTKAKQITVGRLPFELALHINRSIYDEWGNQLKNTAPVRVPAKLQFLNRWCAPLGGSSDAVEATYELKCIVTHYGRHDNGHYIALGKRGKEWYSFNDEIVTKISEEEVLSHTNGFMLFYEATPMPSTSHVAMAEPVDARGFVQVGDKPTASTDRDQVEMGIDLFECDSVETSEPAPSTQSVTESSQHSRSTSMSSSPDENSAAPEAEILSPILVPAMRTAGVSSGSQQHITHVVSAL